MTYGEGGAPSLQAFESAKGLIEYMSWNGSSECENIARSSLLFFLVIAGILQLFFVSPRYKFLSIDGRTNKSLFPLLMFALLVLIITALYMYFPSIAIGLLGVVVYSWETYAVLIAILGVWFVTELALLKKNVFKRLGDRFERFYVDKLRKTYSDQGS